MIRFETLIERHHDELFRYLWQLLRGTRLDAADFTQETWLRAWKAYDRLRPNSNARSWLYRIATNCALSALQRSRREVLLGEDVELPSEASLPEENCERGQLLALVVSHIEELPPRQRAAVLLRYGRELRYEEIAGILGCSQESARAHVSHGIRRLRRELEEV